jgi:hypothetical protein
MDVLALRPANASKQAMGQLGFRENVETLSRHTRQIMAVADTTSAILA